MRYEDLSVEQIHRLSNQELAALGGGNRIIEPSGIGGETQEGIKAQSPLAQASARAQLASRRLLANPLQPQANPYEFNGRDFTNPEVARIAGKLIAAPGGGYENLEARQARLARQNERPPAPAETHPLVRTGLPLAYNPTAEPQEPSVFGGPVPNYSGALSAQVTSNFTQPPPNPREGKINSIIDKSKSLNDLVRDLPSAAPSADFYAAPVAPRVTAKPALTTPWFSSSLPKKKQAAPKTGGYATQLGLTNPFDVAALPAAQQEPALMF